MLLHLWLISKILLDNPNFLLLFFSIVILSCLVYLQYNVTLNSEKSVSENARNAVLGVKNTKIILPPGLPTITYSTLAHQSFCHQQQSVISLHSVLYGPFL